MSGVTEVAIIGAGPYGLSLAAYLRAAAIPYRIFGRPMDSLKNNMPPGMLLKSRLRSSSLCGPSSSFTLKHFHNEAGIQVDDLTPPTLETFVACGETFQARFVPNVELKLLVKLKRAREGFIATFDDSETVVARNVVLAIGVHPSKYIPDDLRNLPNQVFRTAATMVHWTP